MSPLPSPLLLIGGGNMGSALLAGWLAHGLPPSDIHVVEPKPEACEQLRMRLGVATYASIQTLPADFSPAAVVLAIKPQQADEALQALAASGAAKHALVISILAGKTIAFFEHHLGASARVVRVMPNTPALIGWGMSACIAGRTCSDADKKIADALFAAVGKVAWLEDENLMHAVTALSGSGPAYVFYFAECLIRAGIKNGLSESLATQLALQTLSGSVRLIEDAREIPLSQLRKNVTSPGGTTEAALHHLGLENGDAFAKLVENALVAAVQQSVKLSEK